MAQNQVISLLTWPQAYSFYPFQHPDEYQIILDSSTGSNGEKRLGATFIPRFFKYFPDLQLAALNCLMDLCEDEDANVSNTEVENVSDPGN